MILWFMVAGFFVFSVISAIAATTVVTAERVDNLNISLVEAQEQIRGIKERETAIII